MSLTALPPLDDAGLPCAMWFARVALSRLATYDPFVTDAAKKLLAEVLALPEKDQRWLSDALLDRMDPISDDVREAWNRVAVERLERGEDEVVPWDEVEARISAALRGE